MTSSVKCFDRFLGGTLIQTHRELIDRTFNDREYRKVTSIESTQNPLTLDQQKPHGAIAHSYINNLHKAIKYSTVFYC